MPTDWKQQPGHAKPHGDAAGGRIRYTLDSVGAPGHAGMAIGYGRHDPAAWPDRHLAPISLPIRATGLLVLRRDGVVGSLSDPDWIGAPGFTSGVADVERPPIDQLPVTRRT